MAEPLVSYTGHPFVDVGAATLAVMAGKRHPEELTIEDLDDAADEMLAAYKTERMKSYLSTASRLRETCHAAIRQQTGRG